eukprot:g22647.t1
MLVSGGRREWAVERGMACGGVGREGARSSPTTLHIAQSFIEVPTHRAQVLVEVQHVVPPAVWDATSPSGLHATSPSGLPPAPSGVPPATPGTYSKQYAPAPSGVPSASPRCHQPVRGATSPYGVPPATPGTYCLAGTQPSLAKQYAPAPSGVPPATPGMYCLADTTQSSKAVRASPVRGATNQSGVPPASLWCHQPTQPSLAKQYAPAPSGVPPTSPGCHQPVCGATSRLGNKTSAAMKESDEEECPLAPRKRRRLRAQDLEDANADAAVFSCVSAGRVPEGLSAGSQEAAEVSSCVSADRGPVGLSAGSQEAADLRDAETEEDTNIRDAAGARRGRELAKLKPGGTVVVTIGSLELIKKALRLFGRAPGQRRHDLVFYSGRGGMTAAFTRGDELGHSFFFKMLAPLARSGREGDSHLFSSCQDATVVFQYYQQLPTNERTHYVLIRPGRNCALYFDLEWVWYSSTAGLFTTGSAAAVLSARSLSSPRLDHTKAA